MQTYHQGPIFLLSCLSLFLVQGLWLSIEHLLTSEESVWINDIYAQHEAIDQEL